MAAGAAILAQLDKDPKGGRIMHPPELPRWHSRAAGALATGVTICAAVLIALGDRSFVWVLSLACTSAFFWGIAIFCYCKVDPLVERMEQVEQEKAHREAIEKGDELRRFLHASAARQRVREGGFEPPKT